MKQPKQIGDTIRSLKPGDRIPDVPVRRYQDKRGYIRLRWKVGIAEYVETYEHRVFDGRVTTAETVHHANEVKSDNRPENLVAMRRSDHAAHHAEQVVSKWYPYRSEYAARKAARAENRRFDRDRRTQKMRELSAQGMTTIQIGELLGIHPSAVSRYLTRGRNW